MVNIGFSFGTLLGLLDLLLAAYFLAASIVFAINRRRQLSSLGMALYLIQAILVPAMLFLSGIILIFQGWRLDPILQFAYFLIVVTIVFLTIKDAIPLSRR